MKDSMIWLVIGAVLMLISGRNINNNIFLFLAIVGVLFLMLSVVLCNIEELELKIRGETK